MTFPVPNPFSNNAASAFLDVLKQNPTWDVARDAFAMVIEYPNELGYDDGAYVLVAVALIATKKAAAQLTPAVYLPLLDELGDPPADLMPLAAEAFGIASADQNRLADLHLQPEQRAIWASNMSELAAAFERASEPQ